MTETITIALLDTEDPRYSRTVTKQGHENYLVVGIDRARGLVLLRRLEPDPVEMPRVER